MLNAPIIDGRYNIHCDEINTGESAGLASLLINEMLRHPLTDIQMSMQERDNNKKQNSNGTPTNLQMSQRVKRPEGEAFQFISI